MMNSIQTPRQVVFDTETIVATHKKLKNETSKEMILALGHNPETSDSTAHVSDTTYYKNASRSTGHVSYSRSDQINANYELQKEGAQHGGVLHTHIQAQ